MLGFKVNVQKDDKTAELEIQGFTDQETAEGFANEVQETLLVCKDENEEITGFEVGRPGPMEPREGAPEADIEDFIDQITMSVMSPEPANLVKGESPVRFSVEQPVTW
ncbi:MULTISPECIES: hypothetical protein [Micrococcaceae]|uniref:hypothetical protein n=1 Tax=Micrococcaceae TaxID=1268 RepID=UPI00027DF380|nr:MULTISPECIES: hypothetical protein [Micrococcaceae]AFR31293.1 hypothetical protein ARUE_232p00850 [Arthrobacter sp. Rue61a]MCD4850730.1 hypothetical protein [Arthrobacter sp. AK01]MCP1415692.1 hypothetical protein [Paenarthrobacter sp. A20]